MRNKSGIVPASQRTGETVDPFVRSVAACSRLADLWQIVDEIVLTYFPDDHLVPVPGGGAEKHPFIMGVLINPTARNASARPEWSGPRYPFVGVKPFWRVLHRAGFLDSEVMGTIESSGHWPPGLAEGVLNALRNEGIYLTNVVKRSYPDPDTPDRATLDMFLPVLKKEIDLVGPTLVVAFGRFPFFHLTGRTMHLADYHRSVTEKGTLNTFAIWVYSKAYRVIPCYFPIGRGDAGKTIDILRRLRSLNRDMRDSDLV